MLSHPTTRLKIRATWLCLLLILFMFISQTAYVWLFGRVLGLSLMAGSRHGVVVSLSIMTSALTLSVIGLIMARCHARDGLTEWLGFRPFYWRHLAVCTWWLALFLVVSEFITHALGRAPMTFMDGMMSTANLPLLILATVVIAPIYEELIFRGVMFGLVKDAIHPNNPYNSLIASLITSALFALVHVQYGAFEMGEIFGLAMIFCYARIHCDSLIAPTLLHILNNGLAMAVYLFYV
ncbi:CPBP family intramembrane glutamic endopeptidase [Moraxella sp.]|uniref:CPBP family intramembrane glutamic endopeptidase n=1 Tax=Moraxella sp. TaxID=479 RepID=UPI002609395C|nr:CPBP family intramembrane glutamic endopeptidase [Moraxella sp.]MCP3897075.1 CPBP family intramembrane metalloprotease [Moraxella sp.]